MTLAPRWRKMLGDWRVASGRMALIVLALAIGLSAFATIASAYAVLSREISRNYLATNPASALVDVGAVTPEILVSISADPDIASAEPASIVEARAQDASGHWQRTMLFVTPDPSAARIGTVLPQAGTFSIPDGSVALEREALSFLGATIGQSIEIKLPGQPAQALPIASTVHDPSLAPSWQEQTAYAYFSSATLSRLGGSSVPELVKVVVRDATFDQARTDAVIGALALRLQQQGVGIHQVQIPPTGLHPHQSQMTGVLTMFLIFAALALLLSAVLTATMVSGLLSQQVRQIAIMKAIGASTTQLATLYFASIAAAAAVATALAVPLGLWAGQGLAGVVAELLNFDIAGGVPFWMAAALILLGLALPLAFVALPIRRATCATVREALTDQGLTASTGSTDRVTRLLGHLSGLDRSLVLALRNAFRKRSRLLLNLALLGTAGAMFIAALNVQTAWQGQLELAARNRHYDAEIKLAQPVSITKITAALAGLPGLAQLQIADAAVAAVGRSDGLDVVRTYPDGGHGSLSVRPATALPAELDYLLGQSGSGAIANQQGWTLLGRPAIGSQVLLAAGGHTAPFRLDGVVRQILIPATVYLPEPDFAALTNRQDQTAALRLIAASSAPADVASLAAAADAALGAAGIEIDQITTEATMVAAQSGHVKILIVVLIAMATLMAIVGGIGLAASQGSSVTERIREFGIMRTIGASGWTLTRNILAEGLMIGLLSFPVTLTLGLPLGFAIGILIGTLSFGLALPLAVSMPALGLWLAILVLGSLLASLPPARRATRLTIRQTLSHS